jgi:putative phosphotransacetylase
MSHPTRAELVQDVAKLVLEELARHGVSIVPGRPRRVPVGVTARHVHLTAEHMEVLFGPGRQLTKYKDISQPGQFAANEQVMLIGPAGTIDRVRILGPYRKQTQVELSPSDARKLGIDAPIRSSGDLEGTPGISIVGPRGSLRLNQGCIIADRHIHMTPADAAAFGVADGQAVRVRIQGSRSGIMDQVKIRVRDDFALDMHIDTDDANAFGIRHGDQVELILEEERPEP